MKLGLGIKASLSQTLTPQQIQYLKLLQLPVMQLEAQVRQEIESNPMIEERGSEFEELDLGLEPIDSINESMQEIATAKEGVIDSNDYEEQKVRMDDKPEPFEFQQILLDSSEGNDFNPNYSPDDDDSDGFQIKDVSNFAQEMVEQVRLYPLAKEQFMFAEHLIGSTDHDGYLRRDFEEVVDEFNEKIAEFNFEQTYNIEYNGHVNGQVLDDSLNPALNFALDDTSSDLIHRTRDLINGRFSDDKVNIFADEDESSPQFEKLNQIDFDTAEKVHTLVRRLDPPGFSSRTIQECLLSQLESRLKLNAAGKLAKEIIEFHYDSFAKKHYSVMLKNLEVTEDYLKEAITEIRTLSPYPGGLDYQSENNSVIPDFNVSKDDETGELIIAVNDSRIPELTLSKAYEKMRKEAEYKKYNKDTKDWLRAKREDAKFLIQALRQRKATMIKVMASISNFQKSFFEEGSSGIKPLIYKNISEDTDLDISTVCRIVNGKYVTTKFGTFELKYFFSESLPSDDGEDVSTKVIKEALKNIIEEEPKGKPFSDDKLSKKLKEVGYNVARRTVAKYREQLNIPVARLRKELV